ncbi:MAG TPA: hypothetical protein VG846_02495 [Actinomycetota bacterium]|jgi:hypothetical protein|nr:hypothetical protein [Actinomycetota bacterium]
MSAPTLDRHPGGSQAGSSNGRRRSRKQLVLVASALIVVALAVGTSLAMATRPVARQDPAATTPVAVAEDQSTNANQAPTQTPEQGTTGDSGTSGGSGSPTDDPRTGAAAQVLPDGRTPAYITGVDAGNDRIVVDVVQVFHDDEAVKAAIADGKPASQAKYYTGWIRNENSRLRTLPLAANLDVRLMGSCEDSDDRATVLARLADHAKRKGGYYFDLTVADGKVTKIQERMVINAC